MLRKTESDKLREAKARAKKAAEEKAAKKGEKSCFGHRLSSQSGRLDELLFNGITIKVAAKKINSSEARVMSHINHLEKNKLDILPFQISQYLLKY